MFESAVSISTPPPKVAIKSFCFIKGREKKENFEVAWISTSTHPTEW